MYRALPLIFARVFGPPLLVAPRGTSFSLDGFVQGLLDAQFQRGSNVTVERPVDERPRGYSIDHGVATVPIRGVLVRRAGQMAPDSTPLQSYENLSRIIASAQHDSRVRATLLDIDSPGGEAGGVFDLAAEIRRASKLKPIWAIANDDSLSAAYLLASAAHRVWATQTAPVGSVGVVALHADQSGRDAEQGIKYTYVYRGAHKIDANPHSALTADAQVVIQSEVDRLYDKLVTMVADHRAMDSTRIRGTEAGIYFGEKAQAQGLVDQIGTFDEAHAELAKHIQPRGSRMENSSESQENVTTPAITTIADTNIVQLRIDEARAAARAEAVEIAAMCDLAGLPHLSSSYIAEGLNIKTVMQKLQAAQAAASVQRSVVAIDTTTTQRDPDVISKLKAVADARFAELSSPHPHPGDRRR